VMMKYCWRSYIMLNLFVACSGGDRYATTRMVIFSGVSVHDRLIFTFGDERGCPVPKCPGAERITMRPMSRVALKPFALDEVEVTNAQYEHCVDVGSCSEPIYSNIGIIPDYYGARKYNDYPVVNVSALQAEDYCRFAGEHEKTPVTKRLPTELEWEYAIRSAGANASEWPWGDQRDGCVGDDIAALWCRERLDGPEIVGTSADDAVTIVGVGVVYDLMGNVSEWMGNSPDDDLTCLDDVPHCVENFCLENCEAAGCANCRADSKCGSCERCEPPCKFDEDCYLSQDGYRCGVIACDRMCVSGKCVAGNRCASVDCIPPCAVGERCTAFEYDCGTVCEDTCGLDADCRSECARCDYCKSDLGGRGDCFFVCGDMARCIRMPADMIIPGDYKFKVNSNRAIRGGNYMVKDGKNPKDSATVDGTCAMRNSAHFLWKDEDDAAPWLGFRCAVDL